MNLRKIRKWYKLFKITSYALFYAYIIKRPLWAWFYVTRRCNLNCSYCFVKDNSKSNLPTQNVYKIIDKLYSLGIRIVAFFGGEPTLREDLCDIIRYTNQKGMFCYLSTNGFLLNDTMIEKLAKSGVDLIDLSLDSIIKLEGSKKILSILNRNLKSLLQFSKIYGFIFKTAITLTKQNLDSIIDTIVYLNKKKITLAIGHLNKNTYSDTLDDKGMYFYSKDEKKRLIKIIDNIIFLKKQGYKIIDKLSYFENMKKMIINDGVEWPCLAGNYFFAVDHDGAIQLCASLKPYKSNILDIDNDYFKKKSLEIKKIKKWCTKKCFAGCGWVTVLFFKNPFKTLLFK